jgi:hypothetical protein
MVESMGGLDPVEEPLEEDVEVPVLAAAGGLAA